MWVCQMLKSLVTFKAFKSLVAFKVGWIEIKSPQCLPRSLQGFLVVTPRAPTYLSDSMPGAWLS